VTEDAADAGVFSRFLQGLAIFAAMSLGGLVVGSLLLELGVPYARWVGVGLGALAVFAVVAFLYQR
jgi:multidrug transporter EmrE-like cation transporter